jgi:8-oxo-dGTP diphosphatase
VSEVQPCPNPGLPTFGTRVEGVEYELRPAAYAVIRNAAGAVAVARVPAGCWLPGGGSLPGETPEETVLREVREELGRDVRLLGRIGEAVQFFHAAGEGRYYVMRAVFFAAELVAGPAGSAEYEAVWLDVSGPGPMFYHACHDWAVRRR